MQRTKKNREDVAGINQLLTKIAKEQAKINRQEAEAVVSHVRIAHYLSSLRALANRSWARQLQSIGISPRVASRYLKIAEHWPADFGLNESDLLQRLPLDLLKLEWLCRVPQDGLGDLLTKVDCKKVTRSAVIAAVREALGEQTTPKRADGVEQFTQRLVEKLLRTIERLNETFPDAAERTRARTLLRARLGEIRETLATDDTAR